MLYTKRHSAAATNRYMYFPDRLVPLPGPSNGTIFGMLSSGLATGLWRCLIEPWVPARSSSVTDESVGHFVERRLHRSVANNLVSGVMHGIYAGDVWQLSARTLLSTAWNLEKSHGSVIRGMININTEHPENNFSMMFHPFDVEMLDAMRDEIKLDKELVANLGESAMFSFRNGLQELTQSLQGKLENNQQVEFKYGATAWDQKFVAGGEPKMDLVVKVSSSDIPRMPAECRQNGSLETHRYDLVISSLRDHALTPFATVMTVNLYFPNPNLLPVNGFGYLIPQSVPFEQNPERALGVIFDSQAIEGQDTARGTKLTVMLGGHYWDGWEGYPTEEEGLEMARSVICRHLGITDEPTTSHVNLSQDCIPQYTVGYEDRLADVAMRTRDKYRGRLRLVGNQYHGVGVNDCIKSAWMLARGMRGNGWKETTTNLERVLDRREWRVLPTESQWMKTKK